MNPVADSRVNRDVRRTAQSDSIGLIGAITVDIDNELAQLDPTGHSALPVTHRSDRWLRRDGLHERDP